MLFRSAYCALYFAAFGYLSAKAWTFARGRGYAWRLAAVLIVEPVLWAGLEIVRSRLFGGFAWNQLGVPAVNAGFGAPAVLGGVYVISAAVVLVNGTFASIAERVLAPRTGAAPASFPRWARSVETLLPLALVWALYAAASGETGACAAAEDGRRLRVAMVQRNFPCAFSGEREDPEEAYGALLPNLSPLRPDIVALPESAFCEAGRFGMSRADAFAAWVMRESGAGMLLAGGSRFEDGREYNSAALFGAGGEMQCYDKVHLVPFGEYIPGDKVVKCLQKLAPVGSCTPGELKLLDVGGVKAGVGICFEDTDSAQTRRLAEMGAQVLFFITNDSWFSRSDEALQHAWQSVARAIETGIPVVRVGNSGVTGVVSPTGAVSWLADERGRPIVDRAGTMFDVVVPRGEGAGRTPYVAMGDAPLLTAFLLLSGAIVAAPRFR